MTPAQCAARYPLAAANVERAARDADISARVVWAVVIVESGCDPALIGAAGEVGLGQIIPSDQARYPRGWFNDRPTRAELLDPARNAVEIVTILSRNARRFCGRQLDCALATYNGGTRPSARAWRYASRVLWLARLGGD
jgi:soluble lytic murein transglycosylase-like protein